MKTKRWNARILLVAIGTLLAAVSHLCSANDALSLNIVPPEGTLFNFGKLDKHSFVVTNNSLKAVLVQMVQPLDQSNEPLRLSGSVYGSVQKEKDVDAYLFNAMSQQATGLAFHSGLLLPGQKLVAATAYRPVARQGEFRIAYYPAAQSYDGSADSIKPFDVYVTAESEDNEISRRYLPFTVERWEKISETYQTTHPLGPDNSPRAVLVPNLSGAPEFQKIRVSFRYEGSPFCVEDAVETASRTAGKEINQLQIAYCDTFRAFVVFEKDVSWLLMSKEQEGKGSLLTRFPPVLLNDVDTRKTIRVKIGDKQEGFGPDVQKSTRTFWGYAVYYGDGMYTQGEFLHLERGRVLEFLELARTKAKTLECRDYFFGARYFTLNESTSAQQSAPAPTPGHD